MHVRYNTRLIPVIIVSGLFFLAILFSLTFADYFSRGWLGVEGR
jgi:caa(3)-type oxidase subunit IV